MSVVIYSPNLRGEFFKKCADKCPGYISQILGFGVELLTRSAPMSIGFMDLILLCKVFGLLVQRDDGLDRLTNNTGFDKPTTYKNFPRQIFKQKILLFILTVSAGLPRSQKCYIGTEAHLTNMNNDKSVEIKGWTLRAAGLDSK